MANTYTLISSVTVGSGGASSIDFTNIPATYTDLVIKTSTRDGVNNDNNTQINVTFNGSSSSYSNKYLQGNGSTAISGTYGTTYFYTGESDSLTATANTFGSQDIYILNYTGSTYKSVSSDLVSEDNATVAYTNLAAGLWSNTSAITSVTITCNNSFAQHSTAYLYGIKNS